MSLKRYHEKRNFRQTREPFGKQPHRHRGRALSFVIQKHDASRLHYDFRLELDGVLKSWAVPKGIPFKKGEKRLAMHVEDHPLEYGGFEGIIPEGNYGAGSVMLWDRGTWEPLEEDPAAALRKGKLRFRLQGEKLEGEWALVEMKGRGSGEPWLLIKGGDDLKPVSASADDASVKSGRSMDEIASGRSRVWKSNRSAQSRKKRIPLPKRAKPRKPEPSSLQGPAEPAAYVPPMKARLVEKFPAGGDWIYEIKWDGYRALAVSHAGQTKLFTRNHRDVTSDFPDVAAALDELPEKEFVLDGEIVAMDEKGRPSFQLLQNFRQPRGGKKPLALAYYVFDVLNWSGRDLKSSPLRDRKEFLKGLLADASDPIRYSANLSGDPARLLAQAEKQKLEGLVGKQAGSRYEPGLRSGAWIKVKCVNEQEFVIGGYTEPKGSRPYFGALLVGYYEKKKLIFSSKVGTGFDYSGLKSLHARFQKLRQPDCPFVNLPQRVRNRWNQGVSPSEMKRCTWLQPELVCQIRFTEWTSDGGLRHPVFLGLRDDKDAREVVKET